VRLIRLLAINRAPHHLRKGKEEEQDSFGGREEERKKQGDNDGLGLLQSGVYGCDRTVRRVYSIGRIS